MTKIIETPQEWISIRKNLKSRARTLGFVPTMGALHRGHASLIERSLKENDDTLVSIFVNPTQFNDPKDLENYPQPKDADLRLLSDLGVPYGFLPNPRSMYSDGYTYKVEETELSRKFCGAHRPGHFTGMLTVVLKLLNIAQAERAYFGEKDFQQLELVKGLVEAFFIDTSIVGVPTLREATGLAMSSRNTLLSEAEKQVAPRFHESLLESQTPEEARQKLNDMGFKVDYVEDWNNRRLGAVHLGSVRLIDNVEK